MSCTCELFRQEFRHASEPWALFHLSESWGWRNEAAMALWRVTEPVASMETFRSQIWQPELRRVQDQVSLILKTQQPRTVKFWAVLGAHGYMLAKHHLAPALCFSCRKKCRLLSARIEPLEFSPSPHGL